MTEDEECGIYNLFVCEDYVVKTWTFGDTEQNLLCSNMSCTDHDLTGQIVWPASVLLGWFVYANKDKFIGKVTIELGAGCGLGGFVASKYVRRSIITDGNDIVISLLKQNQNNLKSENVLISKLLWGIKEQLDFIIEDIDNYPDIIIGADVIMWPNQLLSLMYTIKKLLSLKKPNSICYISYITRAHSTTNLLYATALRLSLIVTEIPTGEFLPATCTMFDEIDKHMLCITLDTSKSEGVFNGSEEDDMLEIRDYEEQMKISPMPC